MVRTSRCATSPEATWEHASRVAKRSGLPNLVKAERMTLASVIDAIAGGKLSITLTETTVMALNPTI